MTVVGVVHHPSRADDLERLRSRATVSFVTTDEGQGPVQVFRDAWREGLARASEGEWVLILEDDVLPCAGFDTELEAALDVAPGMPLAFFGLGRDLEQARRLGRSWLIDTGTNWNQAVALHSSWLPAFLEWEAQHVKPDYKWWCQRVSLWSNAGVAVSVPSLVQHIGAYRSVVGNPAEVAGTQRISPVFRDDRDDWPEWGATFIEERRWRPHPRSKWAA